jgi:PKD repeat protein
MIKGKVISILLATFLVVTLILAAVAPALAQQGDQIRVTDSEREADQPDVAVDSEGNVHIAYSDYVGGENGSSYEIFYTMLDEDGDTLIEDTLITPDDDEKSKRPAIVVDSDDKVHIVWQDQRWDDSELAYTKLDPSEDDQDGDAADESEITEVDDTQLTDVDDWAAHPRIAIDSNNNIHIVWETGDSAVRYMQIDNDGDENVAPIELKVVSTGRANPEVAVDSDDNAHIVWNDEGDTDAYEIYYMMLDGSDGGTLIDATLITEDDDEKSKRQSILVDSDDNVHIIWQDRQGDDTEIYYKKLDNDGNTLIDDTALTPDDGDKSNHPATAISGNFIHITWYEEWEGEGDSSGPGYLHYMVIDTDGEVEVEDVALIDDKTAVSTTHWTMAYLDVEPDGTAHIVWCDDRTGDYEVWYTNYEGPEGVGILQADFTADPRTGEAPLTVYFKDRSRGNPKSWSWNFGDGGRSSQRNPVHTYDTGGSYTVSLTVTGSTDTETKASYILVDEAAGAPRLVVRDLNVTAVYAQPRQAIGINAKVANEGGSWGSGRVDLVINGQYEQSANVGVAPGTAQVISFTVYKVQAGEYAVTIGEAMGTFHVMEEAPPPPPPKVGLLAGGELDTTGIIFIVVIGIILVGGLVVAVLLTRRA